MISPLLLAISTILPTCLLCIGECFLILHPQLIAGLLLTIGTLGKSLLMLIGIM